MSPKATNPVYVYIIKKPLHLLDSILVGIDVVTTTVDIPDLAVECSVFLLLATGIHNVCKIHVMSFFFSENPTDHVLEYQGMVYTTRPTVSVETPSTLFRQQMLIPIKNIGIFAVKLNIYRV